MLLIFGLIIALGCVEIGVRILSGSKNKAVLRTDRPGVHFYSEQSKSTSDYSYPSEKGANTFRIAAVGDSFTFGFGNLFDDSYPKRLERILNLNLKQPRVEVLNFGSPGFSTKQEVDLVKKAIESSHADLVVLQITLNDPEITPYNAPRGVLGNKIGEALQKRGILKYWKTLGLIVARIANTQSYSDYIKYYQDLFKTPDTLQSFQGALASINEISKKNHVPVVAMIFPLLSFPFDERYPFHEAHKTIHESLESLHIPFFDLLRSFQGLDPLRLQAVPPGFPDADPHPNEIAHRIAAEALYRWLAKKNFIPESTRPLCRSKKRLDKGVVKCNDSQKAH